VAAAIGQAAFDLGASASPEDTTRERLRQEARSRWSPRAAGCASTPGSRASMIAEALRSRRKKL